MVQAKKEFVVQFGSNGGKKMNGVENFSIHLSRVDLVSPDPKLWAYWGRKWKLLHSAGHRRQTWFGNMAFFGTMALTGKPWSRGNS